MSSHAIYNENSHSKCQRSKIRETSANALNTFNESTAFQSCMKQEIQGKKTALADSGLVLWTNLKKKKTASIMSLSLDCCAGCQATDYIHSNELILWVIFKLYL